MPDQVNCGQCGQSVRTTDAFCTFCGANLRPNTVTEPATVATPDLSQPGVYGKPSAIPINVPPSLNPAQPSYSNQSPYPSQYANTAQPLYPQPGAEPEAYPPPQVYPPQGAYGTSRAVYAPMAEQQAGLDSKTIALAVLGFVLAFISLLFIPLFAGAGAIACAIKVRKRSNVLGIVLLIIAVICMAIGILFGVIMGVIGALNHH